MKISQERQGSVAIRPALYRQDKHDRKMEKDLNLFSEGIAVVPVNLMTQQR